MSQEQLEIQEDARRDFNLERQSKNDREYRRNLPLGTGELNKNESENEE